MRCHDHIHQPDCCAATSVRALEENLTNRIHELELVNASLSKRLYDLETDTKFGYLDNSITTLCQRMDEVESAIEGLNTTTEKAYWLLPCAHCESEDINLLDIGRANGKGYYVLCGSCLMSTLYGRKESVIASWNTRA